MPPVDSRLLMLKWRNVDKVGPGDRLYVYQQVFRGTGMSYDLETVAAVSVPKDTTDESVDVVVLARPVEFIVDFEVRRFCWSVSGAHAQGADIPVFVDTEGRVWQV